MKFKILLNVDDWSVSGVDLPDLDDCLRLETLFEDDDFTEGDPDFLHQSACLL
mgnify:CR=1 FL=1